MKTPLIYLLTIFLMSCGSSQRIAMEYLNQDIPLVYRVNIDIKYVPPYCGGAAPSPEMEAERRKGMPWASQVIYMNSDSSDFESFVTDNYGRLRLALLKGNYCLKSAYKVDPAIIKKHKNDGWEYDQGCLDGILSVCDLDFSVTKDTTITYTVHGRCQYEGPTPCINNTQEPPP